MSTKQDQESNDGYTEKIWTKSDGKIEGYVFKGKTVFGKALEGLRGIMKKGINNEIEAVKFKPLDSKIQGVGLEIDVEVTHNKNRGVAILKIYGPKEMLKQQILLLFLKVKRVTLNML